MSQVVRSHRTLSIKGALIAKRKVKGVRRERMRELRKKLGLRIPDRPTGAPSRRH